MGGALVVVLSVSDDCGQAFADQSFCDVTAWGGGGSRNELATSVEPNLLGPTCLARPGELSNTRIHAHYSDKTDGFSLIPFPGLW